MSPFSEASAQSGAPLSNVPELSVSELAFSLKRTLEETYGRVRVRGELSKVKVHSSGHMYSSLKDGQAVIDAVCWRGTLGRLSVRPEEGLEVICTGRVTTYPLRSNYQLVIESMELAGEGALLKLLEDRRKRLAAEGLFHADRKKPLPFLPRTIGVITSPTGAVIRDILHRLEDRFPSPVLLWPVSVQGDKAAAQIVGAFESLKRMDHKPDLVILARGGGSLEDLMPFNEESVVRAIADCPVPVISAVGHETDTSLSDFAADVRAPTPTAAAEMAVPVRLNLLAQVEDDGIRLRSAVLRNRKEAASRLEQMTARLGQPDRILEPYRQRLDHQTGRIETAIRTFLHLRKSKLSEVSGRLRTPADRLAQSRLALDSAERSLRFFGERLTRTPADRLAALSRMLEALSYHGVLERGFSLVRDSRGRILSPETLPPVGENLRIEIKDRMIVEAQFCGSSRKGEGA